jgi:hypothetical protein
MFLFRLLDSFSHEKYILFMEYVREIVDSSVKVNINQTKINELMEGSVTQSLIGAVPHSDITLDEIRSLRLQKYDGSH